MDSSKNSYTVEQSDIGFEGGRYINKNPMSAAKKAASRMFKITNKKKIKFTIRKTTQGENKKTYHYEAVQVTLKTPVVRIIDGKEIINKYDIEIIPLDTLTCNKTKSVGGASKKKTTKKGTRKYKSRGGNDDDEEEEGEEDDGDDDEEE